MQLLVLVDRAKSWDRAKSSDGAVAVKVSMDALRDVPASILVSGASNFRGHSWTCPVVIFQDIPLGGPPADEDPVPLDWNPYPRPLEQFHHPNQNNIFVGPAAFHLLQNNEHVQQHINGQQNINADITLVNAEEEEGWGHWAMPNQQNLVDAELHAGEFLELNDLMAPLENPVAQLNEDENSGITLSLGLPGASASTAESADGGPQLHLFEELPAPLHMPEMQVVADFDLNIPQPEPVVAAMEPEFILQLEEPLVHDQPLEAALDSGLMLQTIETVLPEPDAIHSAEVSAAADNDKRTVTVDEPVLQKPDALPAPVTTHSGN
ncbi:hypothetical protein D1007_27840 [Hordeum vulgare]|nr:hypothetical protein D1007_27840 [Hordeum vulgare]